MSGEDDPLVLAAGGRVGVEGRGAAEGEVRAVVAEAAGDEAGGAAQRLVVEDLAGSLARLQREGSDAGVGRRGEGRRRPGRTVPVPRADDEAVGLHLHVPLARQGAGGARGDGRRRARRGRRLRRRRRRRGLRVLGEVLDAGGGTVRAGADGVHGHEGARLDGAAHAVVVPEFVELAAAAPDDGVVAVVRGEDGLDGGQGVGLGGGGDDAGGGEPVVRRQRLEEADGPREVVGHLVRGAVAGVALGVQRADARAVLAPLVLPEGLVVALVVLPVRLHRPERAGGPLLQDRGDVGVLPALVAVLLVRPVAVIGPVGCDGELNCFIPSVCSACLLIKRTRARAPSTNPRGRWRGSCPRTA